MPAWLGTGPSAVSARQPVASRSFCGSPPAADRPQRGQICVHLRHIEVVQRGAGGRAQLEAGLAALQQQPGQLAGREQPVLRAGAGQIAPTEAVNMRQAGRHLDHAHLLPIQRDDLRQR